MANFCKVGVIFWCQKLNTSYRMCSALTTVFYCFHIHSSNFFSVVMRVCHLICDDFMTAIFGGFVVPQWTQFQARLTKHNWMALSNIKQHVCCTHYMILKMPNTKCMTKTNILVCEVFVCFDGWYMLFFILCTDVCLFTCLVPQGVVWMSLVNPVNLYHCHVTHIFILEVPVEES